VGCVVSTTGRHALSCFSQAKSELDEVVTKMAVVKEAVMPWRVHDLRRTVSTNLQKLGVRLEVNEAVLNHISGSKSGIAGVYQLYNWADEKREALNEWAAAVAAIAASKRSDQMLDEAGVSQLAAWRKFIRDMSTS